jgi:hypothetical protein
VRLAGIEPTTYSLEEPSSFVYCFDCAKSAYFKVKSQAEIAIIPSSSTLFITQVLLSPYFYASQAETWTGKMGPPVVYYAQCEALRVASMLQSGYT